MMEIPIYLQKSILVKYEFVVLILMPHHKSTACAGVVPIHGWGSSWFPT